MVRLRRRLHALSEAFLVPDEGVAREFRGLQRELPHMDLEQVPTPQNGEGQNSIVLLLVNKVWVGGAVGCAARDVLIGCFTWKCRTASVHQALATPC